MTDNDIIKALECCSRADEGLYGGLTYKGVSLRILIKNALDLINRQKAEIEELKSDIATLKDSNINLQELYHTEKEKVAQAKQKVIDACKMLKTARAEAITEFAERLKALNRESLIIWNEQIDQIAKEMKEGSENENSI